MSELKRYRTKPVSVFAIQYTETKDEKGNTVFNRDEIEEYFGAIDIAIDNRKIVFQLSRLAVIPGQLIVKDTDGFITCLDDDVFKLQFEDVETEEE